MSTLDNLNPRQLEIRKNVASREGNAITYFEICNILGEIPGSKTPPEFPRLYWDGQSEKEAEKTLAEYGAVYSEEDYQKVERERGKRRKAAEKLSGIIKKNFPLEEIPIQCIKRALGGLKIRTGDCEVFVSKVNDKDKLVEFGYSLLEEYDFPIAHVV